MELVKRLRRSDPQLISVNLGGWHGDDVSFGLDFWQALGHNTTAVSLTLNLGANFDMKFAEAMARHQFRNPYRQVGRVLTTNSMLKKLELVSYSNEIHDILPISQALFHNVTLQDFRLSCLIIGDAGAIAIANVLASNTPLTTLHLEGNLIGRDGAIAIGHALAVNTVLIQLALLNNVIEAEGETAIARALLCNTTLTSLNLGSNLGRGLEIIKSLTLDQELRPHAGLRLTQGLCPPAIKMPAIKMPVFYLPALDLPAGLRLADLNLSFNRIGPKIGFWAAKVLRTNTRLYGLDLRGNDIETESCIALARVLADNTTLIDLNLGGNFITSAAGDELGKMLMINTTLTSLNLSYNQLELEGVDKIIQALSANTTLTHLDINTNGIRGTIGIADLLKVNTSLQSLSVYLDRNEERELKAVLIFNSTLTSLCQYRTFWYKEMEIYLQRNQHNRIKREQTLADLIYQTWFK